MRADARPGTAVLRALLAACCGLLFLSSGALAQSPSAEDVSSGKYCANCHANAHLIWAGKHGTKADSRAPVSVGCAMCHGDPSEHVKSPANPMPRRFTKMPSAEKNEVCLTCHQGRTRIHWQGSKHERNDVSCSSCHQLHAASDPVRDKLTQTDVCFACHKDIRPMINRPSRHPIREGMVSCSDCHNAHGSVGPSMVIRDTVNDTCYMCHMEKRGPFLRTHQPVQEDCGICHNPHGTTAPNLLKLRQPFLCQSCHEPTGHRGTAASLSGPGASSSANTLARGCVNCHTNIHGTNNPTDINNERTFRR